MGRDEIVVASDFNTRKLNTTDDIEGLARSIAARGLLQPLRLAPREDGRYDLVAGFRRIMALDSLSDSHPDLLQAIPASVQVEAEASTIDNLIENVQRLDLNPVDEARGYQSLLEHGWTQKGIAQQSGMPQKRVKERLQLLDLPKVVIALFEDGKLPLNVRKSLLDLQKASPVFCERAAVRCAGQDHWLGVLAKKPAEIVAKLAEDIKEPIWRVGGAWTLARLSELGETGQPLFERIEQLEADFEQQIEIRLTQEQAEQLLALGDSFVIGTTADKKPIVVTAAADGMVQFLTAATDAMLADFEQRRADHERAMAEAAKKANLTPGDTPAPGADPGVDKVKAAMAEAKEKAQRQVEREKEAQARKQIRGANLDLGRAILTEGARMELSREVALVLCHQLMTTQDAGAQFLAGARLCLEQFQAEDSKGKVTYSPSAKREATDAAFEWVFAAETGEEIIGRTVSLLVMAEYADRNVQPESQRHSPKLAAAAIEPLGKIAEGLVPDALLERVKARSANETPYRLTPQGVYEPQCRPDFDPVTGVVADTDAPPEDGGE